MVTHPQFQLAVSGSGNGTAFVRRVITKAAESRNNETNEGKANGKYETRKCKRERPMNPGLVTSYSGRNSEALS